MHPFFSYLIDLTLTSVNCRSFHVIGQIPWVVLYLRRIPSFARLIQRMVGQGVGLAIQRVKNGSLSRDLFYYLVRSPLPCRFLILTSLPRTEQ